MVMAALRPAPSVALTLNPVWDLDLIMTYRNTCNPVTWFLLSEDTRSAKYAARTAKVSP
jgi:hypothetical protein